LKCFVRLLFKPNSGFWMAFMFQGRSIVSWRWRTFTVTKHQQNDRKCWKNSRAPPRRPLPNNPWARRYHWYQLWSLPGDLNRKFEHVPHCCEVRSPTLDKWTKAVVHKHVSSATRDG
jgi:hypothetical protein